MQLIDSSLIELHVKYTLSNFTGIPENGMFKDEML